MLEGRGPTPKAVDRPKHKAHKVAKKAECRIHRGPFVKAQREATNDAHVKATGPLKAKLKKNLDWLKTTRERMKKNAAKAGQKI